MPRGSSAAAHSAICLLSWVNPAVFRSRNFQATRCSRAVASDELDVDRKNQGMRQLITPGANPVFGASEKRLTAGDRHRQRNGCVAPDAHKSVSESGAEGGFERYDGRTYWNSE